MREPAPHASVGVAALDALPAEEAAALLRSCCGAARWVAAMTARRPFGRRDAVLAAADACWWALGADDWKEAFAQHPRIGASAPDTDARGSTRSAAWSAAEQARVADADAEVRAALAEVNRAYEARFGHTYVVCATGRSAEEMLAIAEARLANDRETELLVAAEEQRKITALRLQKLLGDDGTPE